MHINIYIYIYIHTYIHTYIYTSSLGAPPPQVYAAQFSRHDGGKTVVAGGSGANEIRVFETESARPLAAISLPKGVYGLDLSADASRIAAATGDHHVRMLAMP